MKVCLPPCSLHYVEFITFECFCTRSKDTSHSLFGYDSIQKHSPHSILTLAPPAPVSGMYGYNAVQQENGAGQRDLGHCFNLGAY